MTENGFSPHTEPQPEPTLRRNLELPKGVLQKNLKTFVYLGAALLVIVAALFSSSGKKTPGQHADTKGQPPQPTLQDNTDSNVQELKNQVQAERQKEQQTAMAAAAIGDSAVASSTLQQRTAVAAYGPTGVAVPCFPGQPCPQAQQGNIQMQLTPLQQQAQLIAAKERERADNSRFASNLVYSPSVDPPQQQQQPGSASAVADNARCKPDQCQSRASTNYCPETTAGRTKGGIPGHCELSKHLSDKHCARLQRWRTSPGLLNVDVDTRGDVWEY